MNWPLLIIVASVVVPICGCMVAYATAPVENADNAPENVSEPMTPSVTMLIPLVSIGVWLGLLIGFVANKWRSRHG